MQTRRIVMILAGLIVGLPLLGYIWPQSAGLTDPLSERAWQWPNSQAIKDTEPQPKLLARFWPLQEKAPASNSEADAAQAKADLLAKQTMKLVAIVRQGTQQQALVLTPKGKLKTLSVGDLLDKQRRVTAITNTGLTWQTLTEPSAKDATNKDAAKDNASDQPAADSQLSTPPLPQGELSLFPQPPALLEPTVKDEIAAGDSAASAEQTVASQFDTASAQKNRGQ